MKILRVILAGVFCLTLAACSLPIARTYDGQPRSATEVAVLKNKARRESGIEIDGRGWPCCRDYELLPGPHSVTVDISTMTLTARPATASFIAEAGHVYEVKSRVPINVSSGEWELLIRDATTGKIVSQ